MKRIGNLISLFAVIAVLWLAMVWLRGYDFGGGTGVFYPKSLAATGFIILAAFSMGEFFKLLKIPALLGYIAAGILFGPNLAPLLPNAPEALFSQQVIGDLALVNVLTIGVIGTMGGGELKLADIKENLKTIIAIVSLIVVIVVPGTAVTVMIVADHFISLAPFLEGRSQQHVWAAALLFGVFAVAMSPAATLAILQETRAQGKFTSLVLGVVIVADLVLVAMFLLAFQFDQILLSPEGFTTQALLDELPMIAAEFGYAIAIGIVTGLIFIAHLRFVKREQLFATVLIIFGTAYAAKVLHAETLLAFLTAGFIVQNFSKHGHDMIHALEKISLPVFVIYFMTQAAQLDLQAVFGYIQLTLLLTAVRAVALYVGSRLGSELAGADSSARRYAWLGFFSRGGVDLVLAAMVADSVIPWGVDFQTVIMAVVVVHIVGGPPLLKLALDWAGETEGSRQQTREEAEAFDQLPSVAADNTAASFATPHFEDEQLNERVMDLRSLLVELHTEYIADPLEAKAQAMRESLANASEELAEALDRLDVALTSDEFEGPAQRAEEVAAIHIDYLHDIADNVQTWERINPEIVHHDRIFEMIARIHSRGEFEAMFQVDLEDFLHEPAEGDHLGTRFLKALRRVRRSIAGVPRRNVPLGRLWRYYVELTVPRYLARAADATSRMNENFWTDLGNHMRRIDDLFDEVYDTLVEKETPLADEGEDEDRVREALAFTRLEEGREAVIQREAQINDDLEACAATAVDRYTVSLRETFQRFVDAAARAGTISLPQFRYRPSALFDRSRRAEAQIARRLQREETVVTGQRGWIVAEWQLVLFLYWLDAYERRVREILASMISNPVAGQLDVLRAVCSTLPEELRDAGWSDLEKLRTAIETAGQDNGENASEISWPDVDWEEFLVETIRPALDRTRNNFQRMVALYSQGHAARRLLEVLERRVGQFSEELVLLSVHPDQIGANEVVPTLQIPLRDWFEAEVVRETALRIVEFNERGEAVIRTYISALEDLQQVLEFNLLTAHRDSLGEGEANSVEIASGGMERALRMIDDLRASHVRRFGELTSWVIREAHEIADGATEPFLEHRPAEIERLMNRKGQTSLAARGESWLVSGINRLVAVGTGIYRRYRPIAAEVIEDVQGLFVEETARVENRDIRERLHPDERRDPTIPSIYRRLFTPVPLDIPDFYVDRPEVEAECVDAITDWVEGRQVAMLLYGDRGVGKRSTLHHLLQHNAGLTDRLTAPIHTVVLDDDLQSEAELVARIGAALPNEPAETMEGLVRFIELLNSRHVVVIEHGEKLFSRTEVGLRICRRFLRAMNETSDKILWIVLTGKPAVTFLDTAIGIRDYFTHAIEVDALDTDGIEKMIQRRHRVSGFRAKFERDRPRIRDWIQHPLDTSDALRDPRAEYFRDLARLSLGNPMRALLYWLESARLDTEDDHLIWMRTLPDEEMDVVSDLSLDKRLILAALVQHHTLTPMQLRAILRRDFDDVQTELEHLERLGFVESIAGRQATAYQLRETAEGILTIELRNMNLI